MDKPSGQKVYEFGDFRLDVEHLMVYHRGEELQLPPKAVETLIALIGRSGEIISKDQLLNTVWPDTAVEESNLFLYLSQLRKTLGTQQSGKPWIETLRRRGYRFNGEVRLAEKNKTEPAAVNATEPIELDTVAPAGGLYIYNDRASERSESERIAHRSSSLTTITSVEETRQTPTFAANGNSASTTELLPDQATETRGNDLPRPRQLWPVLSLAFVVLASAGIAYWYSFIRISGPPIGSVAILPFSNQSGNPDLDYLAEGMTEDLIGSLQKLPGLQVKSRSSVSRYKDRADAQTIGKELNAQAILFGSVAQRGENISLHVELVDPQTENRIWADTYNKQLSNLIALKGEVTRDLVRRLRLRLSGTDEQKLAKNFTSNEEAYQLFLKGRRLTRALDRPDVEKGIGYLQQAVDIDPTYALAYAEMSNAYRTLSLAGEVYPGDVLPRAKEAALKAVELDDLLAEAHGALAGTYFYHDWNFAEADKEFRRALQLDPNSWITHFHYGDFLPRMGRREEGRAEMKRAAELEPDDPFVVSSQAFALNSAGKHDEALEKAKRVMDAYPNHIMTHLTAAGAYKGKGMIPESIAAYRLAKERSPDQTWTDVSFARTLMDLGRTDEVRAILNDMLRRSQSRWVPPVNIAIVYHHLGETDQALVWLEKGLQHRDPKMVMLGHQVRLNKLRDNPRFHEILRRVGFDPSKLPPPPSQGGE